jgi:predicted metal-dependent hydrolase
MGQTLQNLNIAYLRSAKAKRLKITVDPTQAITVAVPFSIALKEAEDFVRSKQAWIQKHLTKIRQMENLRKEMPELSQDELNKAQDELFLRLEYFSGKYELSYKKAAFRCQKTRWGSCSGQNNISLNINIAYLPSHLQDYILLHELCHIRYKNHSKAFWEQLDEYCDGRAKKLAKELKTHVMKIRR